MISIIKVNRAAVMVTIYMEPADKVNTICHQGTTIITNSNNSEPLPLQLNRLVPQLKVQLPPLQRPPLLANSVLPHRPLVPLVRNRRLLHRPSLNINPSIRNNTPACILTGQTLTMLTKCTNSTMAATRITTRVTRVCIKVKAMEGRSMVVNRVATTDFPAVIKAGTMRSVE